jgi:hypothetical protein
MTWLADLDRDGYAWVRRAFAPDRVSEVLRRLEDVLREKPNDPSVLAGTSGPAYGMRNLLRLWPDVPTLLTGISDELRAVLGPDAAVVRGLYFDKPPGHSWALPWHRDYTIAVKEHRPSALFAKPTVKAGVPHLEAPESLLARMLTVRIHLDAMTDDNGPLRVVPGSHRTSGELTEDAVTLHCDAGDVLLIRPLVLHASGHTRPGTDRHRRLIHLECAGSRELPDGLEWDRYETIG